MGFWEFPPLYEEGHIMTADTGPATASKRRLERVTSIVGVPAVFVLIAMALHITANALSRRLLGEPLPFTLEISQYWYLPVVAGIGFVVAQLRNDHIVADLLFDRFPKGAQPWVDALGLGICAVVSAGAAWFTLMTAVQSFERHKTAGHSPLPTWPAEAIVGLSLAALAVLLVLRGVAVVRDPSKLQDAEIDEDLIEGAH